MILLTWHGFIKELENYESDTFSASNSAITNEEAHRVAEFLLNKWSSNHLDGVTIDAILEELRDGTPFTRVKQDDESEVLPTQQDDGSI